MRSAGRPQLLPRPPGGLVYQWLTPRLPPSSGDELLLTEMIFNGLFNELTVEQATALLSCFVFQENVSTRPPLPALSAHAHTDKDPDSTRRSRNRPFRFSRFPPKNTSPRLDVCVCLGEHTFFVYL